MVDDAAQLAAGSWQLLWAFPRSMVPSFATFVDCNSRKQQTAVTRTLLVACPSVCVWVQVHDIEDLARIGTRHKACPYFAARHLADSGELVFCPYSYLLDPNIRRATEVGRAGTVRCFTDQQHEHVRESVSQQQLVHRQ